MMRGREEGKEREETLGEERREREREERDQNPMG
jgi:hypothetical protein